MSQNEKNDKAKAYSAKKVVRCSLDRHGGLVVGSLYRPLKYETVYTEKLCQAIKDLSIGHIQSTVWIRGDAKLPDIDWSNSSITRNNCSIPINITFIKWYTTSMPNKW